MRYLLLILTLLLFGQPLLADYDEGIDGDLSNDRLSPTMISLVPGSNQISGTSVRDALGIVDLDYFTITIPSGSTLDAIHLTAFSTGSNVAFMAFQEGSTFSANPGIPDLLGYTHLGLPLEDKLPVMAASISDGAIGFDVPLPAGTYTFWVQETATTPSSYTLDFVLSPPLVPTLSQWSIMILGLLIMIVGVSAVGHFSDERLENNLILAAHNTVGSYMKFGNVSDPGKVDFTLPQDHPDTRVCIKEKGNSHPTRIYIGCAKWNRQYLKGFYPRGTKDELTYYATQFNSIELNATFYRIFPPSVVEKWREKTPENFRFYPKISQIISQFKRLKEVREEVDQYLGSIGTLGPKLGMVFLQMHPTYAPKDFKVLQEFIDDWPQDVRLAVELRHPDWYADENVNDELCDLLQSRKITHIITDTAGRRDLVHMRLTTSTTFIRYTGANHPSDYTRLDDWFDRLKVWIDMGIVEINFFVHQNLEVEPPLLSAYLIKRLNNELGYDLTMPNSGGPSNKKLK